jgi:hypothetical protein
VPRQIIILFSWEEPRKCIHFNGGLHFYKKNLKENEKYIILLQLCIQNLEDKNSK